jgi:ATP-dependent exoDNAse (exonuclease V) alpha subunit
LLRLILELVLFCLFDPVIKTCDFVHQSLSLFFGLLIVVGDGAQLQPVEAGPAFRLVTERIGKSELHTVIRQKEEWQKEATLLFGRQETQDAIQTYMDRGHVHIVEEILPTGKHSLYEDLDVHDREAVIKLYEISSRTLAKTESQFLLRPI